MTGGRCITAFKFDKLFSVNWRLSLPGRFRPVDIDGLNQLLQAAAYIFRAVPGDQSMPTFKLINQ